MSNQTDRFRFLKGRLELKWRWNLLQILQNMKWINRLVNSNFPNYHLKSVQHTDSIHPGRTKSASNSAENNFHIQFEWNEMNLKRKILDSIHFKPYLTMVGITSVNNGIFRPNLLVMYPKNKFPTNPPQLLH